MGLVAAKCPNCGANIEVDNSLEAGICKYCGTPFVTEKAINNYTNIYNTNIAQATIINQERKKEFRTVKVCTIPTIAFCGTIEIIIDGITYGRIEKNPEIEIKIDVSREHRVECVSRDRGNITKSNILLIDNYSDFAGIFIDYNCSDSGITVVSIRELTSNEYNEYLKNYRATISQNIESLKKVSLFRRWCNVIGVALILIGALLIALLSNSDPSNAYMFVLLGFLQIGFAGLCFMKIYKLTAWIIIALSFAFILIFCFSGTFWFIPIPLVSCVLGVALIILNSKILNNLDKIY